MDSYLNKFTHFQSDFETRLKLLIDKRVYFIKKRNYHRTVDKQQLWVEEQPIETISCLEVTQTAGFNNQNKWNKRVSNEQSSMAMEITSWRTHQTSATRQFREKEKNLILLFKKSIEVIKDSTSNPPDVAFR